MIAGFYLPANWEVYSHSLEICSGKAVSYVGELKQRSLILD